MVERTTLDAEIRTRLRTADIDQSDMARAIKRSQGWVNKFINGAGKASIDDVIAIAGYFNKTLMDFLKLVAKPDAPMPRPVGVRRIARDEWEIALLKRWRALDDDQDREDVLAYLRVVSRRRLRVERGAKSSAPVERTTQTKASKGRGTP